MGRPHPGRPRPAPSRLRFCFDEHKQLIRTAMLSFLSGSRERKVSPGFSQKRLLSFSRRLIWTPRAGGAES